MPNLPRDLPHLFVEVGGAKEPYTAHSGGGGKKPVPERDRSAHAAKLTSELNAAVFAGQQALQQRPADTAPEPSERPGNPGFYLEFALESGPAVSEALGRLENRVKGVELVAVREPGGEGGETIAAVFVPERSADYFLKRVDEFKEKSTEKGRPKHEPLVASINAVRAATPRSVFTDRIETFPPNDQHDLWWEIWIRHGFESQVDHAAQRLGIVIKPHVVRFPERDVKVARASVARLAQLMRETDGVAELRLAKDSPAFFMRESNAEQGEWVVELASRLVSMNGSGGNTVSVCLLDGGITQQHPLLAPRIEPTDVHSVDPVWGGADDALVSHVGHGTGMAGLVLYGDLTHLFASSDSVKVPYRLESVKILPPTGVNEPDAYGAITLQGIGRAEIAAPQRHRIVCTAVTAENSGQGGKPSAWSAAIDNAAFGTLGEARLIIVSAGNIRDRDANWVENYLERNDNAEIESPAQAWNALAVGAYTDKVNVLDPQFAGWHAIAPAGDLCPSSRTGLAWAAQWPVKPDVVLEGGNYVHDGGPRIDTPDDLQLLTTGHRLTQRLLTTIGDTSAATALAANFAARIAVTRPLIWPETVRALMVHSAEWTPTMLQRAQAVPAASRKRLLLRRYGYGVPDLGRAVRSASNDLTLIVEDAVRPFKLVGSDVKTREMSVHRLPWPKDALLALGGAEVELRITLSYFVEPNPGERGWIRRHRYASHGLRFAIKKPLESDDAFRLRINQAAVAEEEGSSIGATDSDDWVIGPKARNVGSVHSDVLRQPAAELARRGAIGVFPVGGWWREQKGFARYNREARYSLIATIRVPEHEVDIYTPVRLALGIDTLIATDVDIT